MKKGKFGFILNDEIYKHLNVLCKVNKKQPYDYIVDIIEREYSSYIQKKLQWDNDNE